ncbi:MAG TPA: PEP-CTERM sorting domain-containing protein [Phycisphaerae bacterium]|nr:PEP-CTERM sorting domain-containing protein [Phycisphaerae bacterium]
MKLHTAIQTASLVLSVILTTAGSGYAQGVGNLSSLPTLFRHPNGPSDWLVNNPASGGPVPVVFAPTGHVWGKTFAGSDGGAFVYRPTSPTNPPLAVTEFLQVAGDVPWTGWHEDVLGSVAQGLSNKGWTWVNASILVNGSVPSGLTIAGVGTDNLSFLFDAVAPGSTITVRKHLVYSGPPGAAFVGKLVVHEYPTPEPTSLALLAVGGLWASRRLAFQNRNRPTPADKSVTTRISASPFIARNISEGDAKDEPQAVCRFDLRDILSATSRGSIKLCLLSWRWRTSGRPACSPLPDSAGTSCA